jgi:hypothetical protein
MQRKPNLRHHTTQKNYAAIWYSLLLHLFLFIVIVNLAEVDVAALVGEMWKDVSGPAEIQDNLTGEKIIESYQSGQSSNEDLNLNPLPEN